MFCIPELEANQICRFTQHLNPPNDLERIYDMTRLRKEQFLELLDWLQDRGLRNSNRCTAPEKLVIFLSIIGHGFAFRVLRELSNHSLQTINRAFHHDRFIPGSCTAAKKYHTRFHPRERLSPIFPRLQRRR